jgi:hypothetical protein
MPFLLLLLFSFLLDVTAHAFLPMARINPDFGKYMVVGCYHGFKAEDGSDHAHAGAITVNIPYERDPHSKYYNTPNTADIQEDISDPNFLNHPSVQRLLGTLDTVYLEWVTVEPLTNRQTYKNALALLKNGGKLYFDYYYSIGIARNEPREYLKLFAFGLELANPIAILGASDAQRERKKNELKEQSLALLRSRFENEYKLNMSAFESFQGGANPFNKRPTGELIMIQKGGGNVALPAAQVSSLGNYTPTAAAKEALTSIRQLIASGVIRTKDDIETWVNTFGEDVPALKVQGLQWLREQLRSSPL